MYVYKSELTNGVKRYVVGYWRPAGANGDDAPTFAVASRHDSLTDALQRINYLNGGTGSNAPRLA